MSTSDDENTSQRALECLLAVIVEIAESAHDTAILTQADAEGGASTKLAQDGADIAALATAAAVLGRRAVVS